MSAKRTHWHGYLFVAPATVYLVVFSLVPMAVAAYLSLYHWPLLGKERWFVGLANYAQALGDPFFRGAFWNTVVFAALAVPLGVISSLAVAVLVNQRLRGMAVFRTLYYVPAVSSGVAVSMVWIWIFLPHDGLINTVLKWLGAWTGEVDFFGDPHRALSALVLMTLWPGLGPRMVISTVLKWLGGGAGDVDFLGDPHLALPALVLMSLWMGLGPRMVIFLAGLQGIPQSLYESAEIDGAGPWQRFRHITLPMLVPTTFFVLVTSTISAFQLFTQVYVMTKGGPRRATDVVVYHIYKEAWHKFAIGSASAQSYILLAVIVAISVLQFRLMRRRLREAAEQW